MKQQEKLLGKWGSRCSGLSPWMKVLLLWVFSLHFMVVSAQTDSGGSTPQNLSNDYSALKQSTSELIEKLKSTNYGHDFNALKSTLINLSTELSKAEPSKASVKQLTQSAKAEFENLKNNASLSNDVAGLSASFEDFSAKGAAALEHVAGLMENGLAVAMPVTVPYLDNGPFSIRIMFDSLRFVRKKVNDQERDDKTLVDVDAKFNFPFATSSDGSHIVHFKGKDVPLQGSSPVRIYLLSTHKLDLMKNRVAVEILPALPKGGQSMAGCTSGDSTWLEFDCNGVRDMSLCGRFLFSTSFITPANPARSGDTITANFSFMYSSGMIAKVCFSDSFKVKGCGDFVFTVKDAIVDLSADQNGYGFSLPAGYWDEEASLPEEAWMGFFLSEMSVTFPKNLTLNNDPSAKSSLAVKNVLIDDYGFTGSFFLNEFVKTNSNNAGLDLSLDTISVSFWQGDFSDGLIAGRANVPFLDENKSSNAKGDGNKNSGAEMSGYNLGFRGRIGYNAAQDKFLYSISASLQADQQFKVPFTNMATITVSKDSYLEVGNANDDKSFEAALSLNGSLDINSTLSLKGVRFEGLRFSTMKPHVTVKSFSLVGTAGFTVGGFGIELKKLGLKTPNWSMDGGTATMAENEKDKADLELEAQISLMAGEGGIAAGVGLAVHAEHEKHWKVKGLTINKIMLDLDFSAFHFMGEIERFDEDDVYGDGFRGALMLTLKEFGFGVQGEALFGKKVTDGKTTKYWFTKATADLSGAKIMLFPPGVFLKSFSGGVYYHMSRPVFSSSENKEVKLASSGEYKPDDEVGFGFMAGVGAYFMDPALCSANVEFEMNFNTHWGVNYVRLAGIASILKEMDINATKADGMIAGWLIAEYDRPNKTFHAEIGAEINAFSILKGSANMTIHSDPDDWYFWMGTRSNPNALEFAGLLTAKSYFMLGVIETPMPPMREQLAAQLGYSGVDAGSETVQNSITTGHGFAFGIALEADGKLSIPLDIIYAHFKLLAGTDVLVTKPSQPCGSLDWRAYGQAYLSANGAVGASVYLPGWCKWHPCMKKKKFDILSGSVTTLIYGEAPSPIYVHGELHVKCKLFFIKLPKVDIGVSAGRKC